MFAESASSSVRPRVALAPRWHTGALVSLLLAVALTGTLLQRYGASAGALRAPVVSSAARILSQYLPVLLVNAGLLVYCCWLFRAPHTLPALLGERWHPARRAAVDLALAVVSAVVICTLEHYLARPLALGMGRNAAIASLLPSTGAERLTWALVALCVGFCEEVVYRGYLQTQLAAFSGSVAWGVALQAVLFGLAHLEQGLAAALRIGFYGLLLGLLAHFRRSLLPGIVCHVGLDLLSGL